MLTVSSVELLVGGLCVLSLLSVGVFSYDSILATALVPKFQGDFSSASFSSSCWPASYMSKLGKLKYRPESEQVSVM